MTIRQRLFISFSLILLITVFIIGVFFYSIYNFNEIHNSQIHRYDQIRRVEKLKEHSNSFSWIVLDIITDYDKLSIVKERLNKAEDIYKSVLFLQNKTIENSESNSEKKNLELIFLHFKEINFLIKNRLYEIVKQKQSSFDKFNIDFEKLSNDTKNLLDQEVVYLQNELNKTEKNKNQFIETIKIEVVLLLLIAFTLAFVISSKIIKEIKGMLEKLNKGVLQLFNDDENSIKVDIGKNNELSEITKNLNSYLEKQSDIIHSREELLRNISHELKTPITKGKFLLEDLKNSKYKIEVEHINNVFIDIEELTNKLLQREKLNFAILKTYKFKVSSLILEALSKLSIDDESKIILEIDDDFEIEADKYYMTIALKNLIDNAMKYALEFPIKIKAKNKILFVENIADELSNDLIYYIRPFTREPNQQMGHGLGLNIVNKIIQMHKFRLGYNYKNSHNIFYIAF
ncbi:ATP-binding protein [Halarcobacter sp.]|uniref:ATP-binding protein n=1 Tax=Halarcobacter sp. TaxID=2321133 RepID=UPI002AAB5381|nr:ATP-binding protein [Halarcobacter sp.]